MRRSLGLPLATKEALGRSFERLSAAEKKAVEGFGTAPVATLSWPRADTAGLGAAYAVLGKLAESCRGVLLDLDAVAAFSGTGWKERQ